MKIAIAIEKAQRYCAEGYAQADPKEVYEVLDALLQETKLVKKLYWACDYALTAINNKNNSIHFEGIVIALKEVLTEIEDRLST